MFVQKHFPVLKMILQKVLDDGVPVPKTEDKSVLPSALNRQESDDPSSHSDTELKVIEGEHEPLKMLTVATMETKDTTRLEKAMIKLSMTNNDSLENINNSVKKFNEKITDANNNTTHLEKKLTDMMSDSNNNIERLDNSIEKFNTNNSNDLAEIKKSIQDLKEVMDNTRKEPTDMKQTLNQLMSTIETVEKENILLRSQAQLTNISRKCQPHL